MHPSASLQRLLVVEDSPGDARLLRELLAEVGVPPDKLIEVPTLAEARGRLAADPGWDAVLLDLNLPDSRGMDTLRSVLEVTGTVPVVVLTGLGDAGLAQAAVEAGAQDYVVKGECVGASILRILHFAVGRRHLLARLEQSERLYRELMQNNLAGVYRTTVDGEILDCNAAFAAFFGADGAAGVMGQSAWSLYHTTAERQRFLAALRDHGSVYNWEQCFRRLDGSSVWGLLNATIHRNGDGVEVIDGTLVDINERREAHAALAERERDYRGLLEAAHDSILVIDPDTTTILETNEQARRLYELSEAELVGRQFSAFATRPDLMTERLRRLASGDSLERFESVHRTASGEERVLDVHASRLSYRGRVAVLAIQRDVTETRALEEQLRHSQKMEAVGRLAGGVAHDFNNLLQALSGTATVLLLSADKSAAREQCVSEIERVVERGSALTRQLLVFSRRDAAHPEGFDLNHAVSDSIHMLGRLLSENIEVRRESWEGPLGVFLDRGHLDQVLVNLAVNAAHAMPDGGHLVLRTQVENHWALLEVEDSGSGIPDEIRHRVFEPFFTTKTAATGTGLGLSVVHGIVTGAGGEIEVTSAVGAGTTFRIRLPLDTTLQPAEPGRAASDVPRGAGERVLVVDDEASVLGTVEQLLQMLGYHVATADGVKSALALEGEGFDLLLTDVVLRDGRGPELAAEFLKRMPGLRVLLMSGYSRTAEDGDDQGKHRYLQKPFTLRSLAHELRAAFDDTKDEPDV